MSIEKKRFDLELSLSLDISRDKIFDVSIMLCSVVGPAPSVTDIVPIRASLAKKSKMMICERLGRLSLQECHQDLV